MQTLTGRFVRSIAGKEKGMVFLIIGVNEEGLLLLANGKERKLETPKKKKVKHIEVLELPILAEDAIGMLTNRKLREEVRRMQTLLNTEKE